MRVEAFTVLSGLQVRVAVHCLGHDDREHYKCEGWEVASLVSVEQIEHHGVNDALWMTIGRLLRDACPREPGESTPYAEVDC